MPVSVQCSGFPLSDEEVVGLWRAVLKERECDDEVVTVRCVSEQEIRQLNKRYRGKDKITNVLTFSYRGEPRKASPRGEHDVALCLKMAERKYVARLLAHAFLHVAGMDHEESAEEAEKMEQVEAAVLKSHGF